MLKAEALGRTQKRTTKLVYYVRHLPYIEQLKRLKLPSLAYRRFKGDLVEVYKLLNGKEDTDHKVFFELNESSTRGHPWKLKKKSVKKEIRKNFFGEGHLKGNVASGKERGGSFAVYHKGQPLLHIWGGYADAEAKRPWRHDTITIMYSATKGIAAIVVAYMVDKGYLDYKRPVGDYWPEFNQNGKDNITVEILLSHQAGLPILDTPITRDIIDDPEKVENILAAQKPIWPPGTNSGYHALTYGLYVDTLVKKADPSGRSMDRIFIEDIQKPFGIDMYLNLPSEEYHRAARLQHDPPMKVLFQAVMSPKYRNMFVNVLLFPDSGLLGATLKSVPAFTCEDCLNDPEMRVVPMSSTMGTASPLGPAKLYSILASGGKLDGKVLLKPETITKLFTTMVKKDVCDVTHLANLEFARGVKPIETPMGRNSWVGHPGHGGQVGLADLENGLGISYLTNYISIFGDGDDPRFTDLADTFYQCFDSYKDTS